VTKRTAQSVEDWARKASAVESPAVRELRGENARLRKRLTGVGAQAELVLHAVREAFAEYVPPTPTEPRAQPERGESEVAVLHLSDTQFGKVTPSYDSSVACERVQEFAARAVKCIERHRAYASVDEAHVYLGGDMIEGELIYPGQAHLIDQSVFDQAVRTCPDAIARCILTLAATVQRVHVVGVAGNHGRPASRHAGSHPRTNWDRVVYEVARMMIEGPLAKPGGKSGRITWDIADDFYAVNEVAGHKHLIVHGHQIRGGFAGFPWYGVAKRSWGWIDAIPEEWSHLYFGHFHTYTCGALNGRWFFANGTTESDNEYAREELSASGEPVQRLQFWSRELGLVADRPIYLRWRPKARRASP
jgi:hypothetical protein